jgi:hypothetical protein
VPFVRLKFSVSSSSANKVDIFRNKGAIKCTRSTATSVFRSATKIPKVMLAFGGGKSASRGNRGV